MFLFYVSILDRRKGEGAQARTGGKGGQTGGRGQEQGSFRCGRTGREGKFAGGGRNRWRTGVEEADGGGKLKRDSACALSALLLRLSSKNLN